MPVMMQSATQRVRKRSKTPMAGFASGAEPAVVAESLIKKTFEVADRHAVAASGTAQQALTASFAGVGCTQQASAFAAGWMITAAAPQHAASAGNSTLGGQHTPCGVVGVQQDASASRCAGAALHTPVS